MHRNSLSVSAISSNDLFGSLMSPKHERNKYTQEKEEKEKEKQKKKKEKEKEEEKEKCKPMLMTTAIRFKIRKILTNAFSFCTL